MPLMSAPFMLNSTTVQTFNSFDLFNALDCDTVRDRFLVIVQLKGANDGLNTLIRDDMYQFYNDPGARPDITISESQLLAINNSAYTNNGSGFKLHPNMTAIHQMCEEGKVNFIQSAGYPVMNRSHFAATDLWLTGGDGNNQALQEGWMGKYLEYIFEGYNGTPSSFMPDPLGIHLKSKTQSLGYHTASEHLKAINLSFKNNGFYEPLSELGLDRAFFENQNCSDRANFMVQLDSQASVYGSRVSDVFAQGTNSSVDYGSYDLGAQLRTIARLVNGGSRTKIFLTEMTGFDTHVGQLNTHANLMDQLSNSVSNFMEDLANMGLQERCLIVTFSEFGRKFISNQSAGTDHGTLAPMMVFGHPDKINAGITGPAIDVTNLDNQGAPQVTSNNYVDYREVYIQILKQWLGANTNATDQAFAAYTPENLNAVDLIKSTANATPNAGTPLCYATSVEETQEFAIVVPILPPDPNGDQPLQEITACNYVDLLPGFAAPMGSNVIIYPLECPPQDTTQGSLPPPLSSLAEDTQLVLAIFNPEKLDTLVEEQVLYTRKTESGKELNLLEKINGKEQVKLSLYPNPTADFLMVQFNLRAGENRIRLEILDLNGKVLPIRIPSVQKSVGRYEVRLDLSGLSSGHYFLRYESEKLMETFKFAKID